MAAGAAHSCGKSRRPAGGGGRGRQRAGALSQRGQTWMEAGSSQQAGGNGVPCAMRDIPAFRTGRPPAPPLCAPGRAAPAPRQTARRCGKGGRAGSWSFAAASSRRCLLPWQPGGPVRHGLLRTQPAAPAPASPAHLCGSSSRTSSVSPRATTRHRPVKILSLRRHSPLRQPPAPTRGGILNTCTVGGREGVQAAAVSGGGHSDADRASPVPLARPAHIQLLLHKEDLLQLHSEQRGGRWEPPGRSEAGGVICSQLRPR